MPRGKPVVKCAVVGYGGAFAMGKFHADSIIRTPGLELVAVCDIDPSRLVEAKKDFAGVRTYPSLTRMLAREDFDLAVIVTPHNTHARLALQCLKAGKHVIVEKPMCLRSQEATAMIEAAREKKVMLSVYHNRRWDGDYLALRQIVGKGLVGEVFHMEAYAGGYRHPGKQWRSDKRVSGGALWDWGAHFVDWILGLVQEKVSDVAGYFHKRKWHDVSNEDQAEAIIRFASGAVANLQMSSLARAEKPRWRILGTEGAIVFPGAAPETLRVYTTLNGLTAETEVKQMQSDWSAYYRNIASHLRKGEPLAVTPESARRVISVMEAAERSARSGRPVRPAFP